MPLPSTTCAKSTSLTSALELLPLDTDSLSLTKRTEQEEKWKMVSDMWLQVHGSKESGIWKPDKKLIKSFTAKDVRLVLRKFVSSNTCRFRYGPSDCSFASTVYGGSAGILAQLLELKEWFEHRNSFL
jgi:hypothetical protein